MIEVICSLIALAVGYFIGSIAYGYEQRKTKLQCLELALQMETRLGESRCSDVELTAQSFYSFIVD